MSQGNRLSSALEAQADYWALRAVTSQLRILEGAIRSEHLDERLSRHLLKGVHDRFHDWRLIGDDEADFWRIRR